MLKSISPYNEKYNYIIDHELEKKKIKKFINNKKETVVVQGLGFVGSAMIAALSLANKNGESIYNVIGVDLADTKNYWKIGRVNSGKPPVISEDKKLNKAYYEGKKGERIFATYSKYAYKIADIVVIDINLDIHKKEIGNPYDYSFSYEQYINSINSIADNITEETLIVVESTVPPGTTEKILYPLFKKKFQERNLDINRLFIAHSYERVMPGKDYLDSIVNFYRVYSGIDRKSKNRARSFLSSFINVKNYPLCELHSTNASEIAKVLENSFRAVNIAFIQEWTELANCINVNLYEIIDAIRKRPTHKNIMLPGFGVGGYCLTKDALLADWAKNNLFRNPGHLKMSLDAIKINDLMPNYTFNLIKSKYPLIKNFKIGIFGISYLNDVADTRYSPAELLYKLCLKENASIFLHDELVSYWEEQDRNVNTNLDREKTKDIDIAVFTVRHKMYLNLSALKLINLMPKIRLIVDANNIFSDIKAEKFIENNVEVIGVGKGHWNQLLEEK